MHHYTMIVTAADGKYGLKWDDYYFVYILEFHYKFKQKYWIFEIHLMLSQKETHMKLSLFTFM